MKLRNNDVVLVDAELAALADEKHRLSQQSIVKWQDFWYDTALRRPLIVRHIQRAYFGLAY